MLTSPVFRQLPIRLSLSALIALCLAWQILPARVHSSSLKGTPDIVTGSLNTAREGHTTTLLQNGKVLVVGGRNGSTIFNTAEVYDPVTGQWSPASNALGTARHGHNAVLLRSGLLLVLGGQGTNGFLNSAEIYDPFDNSWKPAQSSQMNQARYHATATLLNNGRVLVTGGVNGNGFLRSAELYDPATRTWTRTDANNNNLGNLTEERAEHTATLLTDGRVLVSGGLNGTTALKSTELYEPNNNRWRRVGDLVTARRLHSATLLPDNTVLVAGGLGGGNAMGSAETYNPATSVWTATGSFSARRSHTATLLPNGRVLAVGGKDANGSVLNSAEVYNYANRTWSNAVLGAPYPPNQVFTLSEARSDHTATILPNAQVLIAGGLGTGNAVLGSAELYEYAVPTWSVTKNAAGATTQMLATRAAHTATLLSDGKVLVAGGQSMTGTSFVALSSAELYDPSTGTWTATGSLITGRYNHTATLLPNGKVLISGGNSTGQALDTAELYDPATGFFTQHSTGTARYNHTATMLQSGNILVVGGIGAGGNRVTLAQIYNPNEGANGTWTNTANLTPARSGHTATLLPNGTVLIFGGLTSNTAATNSGALFTPNGASGSWSALNFVDSGTSAAPNFRYGHTATLLPTGKVLMTGGRGGLNASNVSLVIGHSEFYNVATRTFERGRAITASRINHTATVLPNGKVLLFGGRTLGASTANCPEPSSNPPVQLFDPYAPLGSPTSVAQLANPVQARNVHAATLLANGEVLITGGFGEEVQPSCTDTLLRHSELFNSGLNFQESWRPAISFLTATANYYTVNGAHFQGISEASGHGAQSSSSSYPVAILQSLDNEQLTVISLNQSVGWTNNTFSFGPLSGFPSGPALLTIIANGIPSAARVVGGNGGNLNTTAAPTGTISGRVQFHNGEGIVASLTLAPTASSPNGCSATRTLTTAPNGDFVFRDLVIAPTPTPQPMPTINCGSIQTLTSTQAAGGLNITYSLPTVSPAGTAVSCNPASGSFFPYGTTPVTCTATNTGGTASCGFNIVASSIQCPADQTRSTSGNGLAVTYPAPTVLPANFTSTCTPPSGSFFPVGTTTVTCRVAQNQTNFCSFRVIVQAVVGLQGKDNRTEAPLPEACQAASISSSKDSEYVDRVVSALPAGRAERAVPLPGNMESAEPTTPSQLILATAAGPEQQVGFCRYQLTPSATFNGQPIRFFPTNATFNMTSAGGSFLIGSGAVTRMATPDQTGTSCTNCINNVFVSQGPFWNLGTVVQKQGGQTVSDVMLEFSVPYEIFDDRLVCKDAGGNDIPCTNGTKTVAGDVCTKTSSNPLITDAEYKCACTAPLNPDGSCPKTVLARYPMASNTGTFTVANVPNGANAVLTPGTIAGGAQYTFAYQPVSPPGLPAETFVRLDHITQSYDNLLITALTACTPATAMITPNGATTFCDGGAVMLTANGDAGATYRWYRDGALTAFNTKTISVTLGGAYAVEFTDTSGCASMRSAVVPVTVNARPTKPVLSPSGPLTLCEGQTLLLNAPAGAASYQWFNNGVPLANTTTALTISTAGSYTVVTTNAATCTSEVSDPVIVTVVALPSATITPATTQICANSTGNQASVPDSGAGASYNWTINGGSITSGQGTRTLTYSAGASGSVMLNVTVTNTASCSTNGATNVTVNPLPSINTQPGNQTVCENGNASFSANANNATAVQWQVSTDGGASFENVAGGTNAMLSFTVNTGQNGYRYRALFSNTCGIETTNAALLSVNPRPAVTTQPIDQTVCENSSVSFTVAASSATSVQWQVSTDSGNTFSNVPGATNNTLSFSANTSQNGFRYRAVFTNTCGLVNSNTVTLNVNPLLNISAQPANQSVCIGASANFSVMATGTAPLTYQWRKNGSPINGATQSNYAIPAASLSDGGNYDVVITSGCGTVTSNAAALTLNAFALSATTANFTATGGTGAVDLSATVGQCTWNVTSNADWLMITAGASGTGNGRINYSVAANNGTASRQAMLTIAGLGFTVTQSGTAPAARIEALSQTSALVGSVGFSLTVTGVNFTNTTKVRWNSSERPTSFISATQLIATLMTADLAVTGTFVIDVFDPPPGGGASNQLSFTVQNPVPQIANLNPASREAGSGQFTLTVNGSNFVSGAVVRWNNNERTTMLVNATQLTALIPATDLVAQGTATVTVVNPAPGGGASGGVTFTINQAANPLPILNSLAPNVAAAGGGPFTLTLTGSGFINGAVVRWNNNDRTTSFVSSTQLSAQIPASDIATVGTAAVTVFNPAPGGGTSGPQSFSITNGPTITSLTPSLVLAGGAPFTLTINGANLTSGAQVRVNGNERPTAFVNTTRVTAEIPASDIATPGIARITVALPGGSLSNETTLTIAAASAHVSAASFTAVSFAPDSIIACFGTNLATGTESSSTVPLPTILAGTRLLVRDSAGITREAPLFFVSPNQINYLLPTGTATGTAFVAITASNGAISGGQIEVTSTAPGLFSANANGRGVPAAILIRATGNAQRVEQVARFDTATNSFVPIPIDLGAASDQVYLILFGTGIRYRNGLNNVSCTIGGTVVDVSFASAQGDLVGLDQINLGPLPRSLAGRGNVNLVLTVEGRVANTVQVTIQ
jgi:uncharacterized protein (TIGR03437 family)